ncbi:MULTISPECIES: ferredoxin reductase [Catenuloplanes]|uniref:Ferredoxin-NADP reductase n=1 Tax=Catenuloplanes niger TaxID=587534 RepID=A0AAE3ZR93_9ACTN|nr:ferredoxin reductase [Catenuloplanes niger]MDR7324604.1 ferredoxin-NADP reductase [Catenuloplanes niger]
MARAAVSGRLSWRTATLVEARAENASARTLVFDVPGWPGHLAGQHVDVRLTADDGYTAQRSYSMSAPADGARVEITVQTVADGEVSPYLVDVLAVGDAVELRGPIGGWFVWRPEQLDPVLLVAGGSGVVPLMAMIRARRKHHNRSVFRLIYSVRTPDDVYYADELRRRARDDHGLEVTFVYTRFGEDAHRISVADVNTHGWPPELEPACFVCGPTGFVETVADILVALGHDPRRVRTERFGPS